MFATDAHFRPLGPPAAPAGRLEASGGRFQLVEASGEFFLLDAFHGQKTQLAIRWDVFGHQIPVYLTTGAVWYLRFFDETTVILQTIHGGRAVAVLCALDVPSATLFALDLAEIAACSGRWQKLDGEEAFAMLRPADGRADGVLTVVDVRGDRLRVRRAVRLPPAAEFAATALVDGRLVGFEWAGERLDPRRFVEFSLETGERRVHEIEVDAATIHSDPMKSTRACWMDGRFFFGRRLPASPLSAIAVFDPVGKRWTETGFRAAGDLRALTAAPDGLLLVESRAPLDGRSTAAFFRLAHRRPKALAESCWTGLRNEVATEFVARVVARLPPNCDLRCPWTVL
ncbi:hypothetical protein M3Y99_00648200 [Aphelenchoides fujianensis]|nr:hypothetical protein M3Y99_00648200 [Aphelenchoides fujianensis]